MKKIIHFLIVFSCVCFSQENFWEQTNGPSYTRFGEFATNSSGDIFAGINGVVCRSTDNGDNWVEVAEIRSDYLLINSSDVIFAGSIAGIFRSTDSGDNWVEVAEIPCNCLLINSSDVIFAGSSVGIFKSTDCGNNWNKISDLAVVRLAKNSKDYIYATSATQIYISTDDGENWNEFGPTFYFIDKFAISPNDIILVGFTYIYTHADGYQEEWGRLDITTDNGKTWNENALHSVRFIYSIGFNTVGDIFVGSYFMESGSIFRSTDNGNNWDKINNGFPLYTGPYADGTTYLTVVTLATSPGGVIYAGTDFEGVFRSTDNGDNWSEVNNDFLSKGNFWVSSLEVNLNGDVFAWISHFGVFRSTNSGDNWAKVNVNIGHISSYSFPDAISSLAINSSGHIFATSHGVYRSEDNDNSWEYVFGHLTKTYLYGSHERLTIDKNDNIYAAGSQGIFKSTDNGETWANIYNDSTRSYSSEQILCLNTNSVGDIIAYTEYEGLIRSTDEGNSWSQINKDVGVSSIAINSNGDIYIGTNYAGVLMSTDNGDNWAAINNGLYIQGVINAIAINSSGDIFIGKDEGIYRTTDNGNNWVKRNSGLKNHMVGSLVINSYGYIYAGIYKYFIGEDPQEGIFISTDNGEHWNPLNSGLTSRVVHSLAINEQGYIYAGTNDGGVFRSVNSSVIPVELIAFNGSIVNNSIKLEWSTATETNNKGFEIEKCTNGKTNWQPIGFVEGNGTSTNKNLYSYTDKSISGENYFYRLKQIDFDGGFHYSDVVEINFNAPLEFSISQNFPNPFNPTTEIKYSIPASLNLSKGGTLVRLEVYDILGRLVAILVNKNQQPGNYKVEFNASSITSGIYFYTLTAGNFHQTKKMVLLK